MSLKQIIFSSTHLHPMNRFWKILFTVNLQDLWPFIFAWNSYPDICCTGGLNHCFIIIHSLSDLTWIKKIWIKFWIGPYRKSSFAEVSNSMWLRTNQYINVVGVYFIHMNKIHLQDRHLQLNLQNQQDVSGTWHYFLSGQPYFLSVRNLSWFLFSCMVINNN